VRVFFVLPISHPRNEHFRLEPLKLMKINPMLFGDVTPSTLVGKYTKTPE